MAPINEGEPVLTGNESEGQIITNDDGDWEVIKNENGQLDVAFLAGKIDEVEIIGDQCLAILKRDFHNTFDTYEGQQNLINGTFPTNLVFTGATENIKPDCVIQTITLVSNYLACKNPHATLSGLISELFSAAHKVLDVISIIPVIGDLADAGNTILYTLEGDEVGAAASASAIILGSSGVTVPLAKKAAGEIIEETEEKIVKEVTQGIEERSIRKKVKDDIPSLDHKGKVHGKLPNRKEWMQYSREEKEHLLNELKKSVKERSRVNSTHPNKDKLPGHSRRLNDELDLIRDLEHHLYGK